MRLSVEDLKIKFLGKMVYVAFNPKHTDWPEELQHVPVKVESIVRGLAAAIRLQDLAGGVLSDGSGWRILVTRPYEGKTLLWSCLEEDVTLVEEFNDRYNLNGGKPIVVYTSKCNACNNYGRFIKNHFLCSNVKCKTRKIFLKIYAKKQLPTTKKSKTIYEVNGRKIAWLQNKDMTYYVGLL